MSHSTLGHYTIEKFLWEKDVDIISYVKNKNDLRRKNGVIQYSIFEFLRRKHYYVGYFHFPDFRTYRMHIQKNIEIYPEIEELLQAQDYIEFNLTKKHEVILKIAESDLYSILRIYVPDYNQFEKTIINNFPDNIGDSVLKYTIFTNHTNDNIVLFLLNWVDETSFNKYFTSYEIQKKIMQYLSINDLDNDLLMKKIYSWKAA